MLISASGVLKWSTRVDKISYLLWKIQQVWANSCHQILEIWEKKYWELYIHIYIQESNNYKHAKCLKRFYWKQAAEIISSQDLFSVGCMYKWQWLYKTGRWHSSAFQTIFFLPSAYFFLIPRTLYIICAAWKIERKTKKYKEFIMN